MDKDLLKKASEIRALTINCIASLGSGHIGGSLSIVDLLTVLYYKVMNIDPTNPHMEGRDRLVVSKGHAGPAVYATLAHRGYFDQSLLLTLNRINTNLPSHCDMNKTIGIDMTTGSLGQGISCGVGLALGSRIKNDQAITYIIVGDGETQEGQVWEAAMFASHKQLDRLVVFVDLNQMQIDGYIQEVNDNQSMVAKWEAFGFDSYNIDGHDLEAIEQTINQALLVKGKPHAIILNTIKGKGVTWAENAKVGSHSMAISSENQQLALSQLKEENNGI